MKYTELIIQRPRSVEDEDKGLSGMTMLKPAAAHLPADACGHHRTYFEWLALRATFLSCISHTKLPWCWFSGPG